MCRDEQGCADAAPTDADSFPKDVVAPRDRVTKLRPSSRVARGPPGCPREGFTWNGGWSSRGWPLQDSAAWSRRPLAAHQAPAGSVRHARHALESQFTGYSREHSCVRSPPQTVVDGSLSSGAVHRSLPDFAARRDARVLRSESGLIAPSDRCRPGAWPQPSGLARSSHARGRGDTGGCPPQIDDAGFLALRPARWPAICHH